MFSKAKIYIFGGIVLAIIIYLIKLELQVMTLKSRIGDLIENNKNLEVKNTILESNKITLEQAIKRQNDELTKLEEKTSDVNKKFEDWVNQPDEVKYGNLTNILKPQEGTSACNRVFKKLDMIKLMRTSDL